MNKVLKMQGKDILSKYHQCKLIVNSNIKPDSKIVKDAVDYTDFIEKLLDTFESRKLRDVLYVYGILNKSTSESMSLLGISSSSFFNRYSKSLETLASQYNLFMEAW